MATSNGGSIALTGAKLFTNTTDGQSATAEQSPADNQNSANSQNPTAILIIDGRIAAVGGDSEISARAEAEGIQIRNLKGAVITPGLYDSHTHPHWAADVTAGVDLGGLDSIEKIAAALAEEAKRTPDGAWVRGWNLEFEPFLETGMRGDLFDEALQGKPFAAMCYDLHTGLANRPALEAAGITGAIEFSDTSEVVVDENGVPTGELREPSAYQLVFNAAPAPSHDEERDALRDMFRRLASVGLTGGAIMDGKPRTVDLIEELENRGELDQRLTVHHWHAVGDDDEKVREVIAAKDRAGRIWQTGAIKLFSDGVIDTGTAWLHEADTEGDGKAAFWPDWNRYVEVVNAYHDAGMFIATHAVGDYAVSQVLKVYENLAERPDKPFHTIEHLEVLSNEDIAALKDSGVTASMQPLHMQWREGDLSDNWAERLGERAATGYRVRDVLESGTRVVLGSDWPVAQYDPRIGMAWAMGRRTPGDGGAHVFEPEQKLTAKETLLAYTLWPAQARGRDDMGVLREGAVGDLTVWASSPLEASADEIAEIPFVMTVVDGRIVFEG